MERLKKLPFIRPMLAFIKKYGIDAVLALLAFNFPIYGMAFISNPDFVQFGTWWTALWWGLGPLTPGWLFTIVLAVFIRWLRLGAYELFLKMKEALNRLRWANSMLDKGTSEELEYMHSALESVNRWAEKELRGFKEELRKERLKKLDDQWTKVVHDTGPEQD